MCTTNFLHLVPRPLLYQMCTTKKWHNSTYKEYTWYTWYPSVAFAGILSTTRVKQNVDSVLKTDWLYLSFVFGIVFDT